MSRITFPESVPLAQARFEIFKESITKPHGLMQPSEYIIDSDVDLSRLSSYDWGPMIDRIILAGIVPAWLIAGQTTDTLLNKPLEIDDSTQVPTLELLQIAVELSPDLQRALLEFYLANQKKINSYAEQYLEESPEEPLNPGESRRRSDLLSLDSIDSFLRERDFLAEIKVSDADARLMQEAIRAHYELQVSPLDVVFEQFEGLESDEAMQRLDERVHQIHLQALDKLAATQPELSKAYLQAQQLYQQYLVWRE